MTDLSDFTIQNMNDPDFPSKKARHWRVARAVWGALLTGEWKDMGAVFACRMSEQERVKMAGELLAECHPQNAIDLTEMVVPCVGQPDRLSIVHQGVMKAARMWARAANPKEKTAFAVACIEAMDEPERKKFREWFEGLGSG